MTTQALATLDTDRVISRLAGGEFLRSIAQEFGVDKSTIYRHLRDDPRYREAIVNQAESLVEQATAEAFKAETAVSSNIARARVDAAHKWAAAKDPATWGSKANIVNVQVNVAGADQLLAGSAVAMLAEIMPDAAVDT